MHLYLTFRQPNGELKEKKLWIQKLRAVKPLDTASALLTKHEKSTQYTDMEIVLAPGHLVPSRILTWQ
jgi:hypothetical protein